jgi:hypothetical protein
MSPTVAECLEHARQCDWYAARTNDEGDRKFLLWRAQQWTKLAQEKEREAATRLPPSRLGPSLPSMQNAAACSVCSLYVPKGHDKR